MPHPHFTPEPAYAIPAPGRAHGAWHAWEAHLDAGRIGGPTRHANPSTTNTPLTPARRQQ